MCRSSSPNKSVPSTFGLPRPSSKKHHKHLQFTLLKRKRRASELTKEGGRKTKKKMKSEIEMKNLKLYMENQSIIEENERLRKKALLLHQENQALLSQLQNKLSHQATTKLNLIN
ncbi:protein LITTLE ZIPPER 2-like [Prosopis cineraria]|uniref:protein LITTLE ZIPPER 2-like n=1 Tax=Prosopis cineraria TaxID=364024 RepID=UPI00240EFBD4|nr:protein LITTLE ZIPPER 2-like [Prosopis cineraria]